MDFFSQIDASPASVDDAIRQTYADDRFWSVLMDQSVGAGPFDGACRITAMAIQMAFGGALAALVGEDGVVHHYGVTRDGLAFDFDGLAQSLDEWRERFSQNENITVRLFPVTSAIPENDIPTDPAASRAISALLLANA